MKRWILSSLLALTTLPGVVGANSYGCDSCCDPCYQSCDACCDPCCGKFEILGEYLYIRPHHCDLNFVIVDDRPSGQPILGALPVDGTVDLFLPFGKELGIDPDYESAFRVGVGYVFNCGCTDIRATYTRLCTRDHLFAAANGDQGGLWITYAHPRYNSLRLNNVGVFPPAGVTPEPDTSPIDAFARGRVRVEYNMVDVVAGSRGRKGCDLWYRAFVGLRWADICVSKSANYQGTITSPGTVQTNGALNFARQLFAQTTRVHTKLETWGIGPRVGLDLRYDVFCGFGIGAHAGASILVGESTHITNERDIRLRVGTGGALSDLGFDPAAVDEPLNSRDHSRVHLFPEIDARLGINYLFCCGNCFSVLLEVGWEFVSYINANGRIRFNDVAGTNREVCESFSIDGLYVSVLLSI